MRQRQPSSNCLLTDNVVDKENNENFLTIILIAFPHLQHYGRKQTGLIRTQKSFLISFGEGKEEITIVFIGIANNFLLILVENFELLVEANIQEMK